jgi:hypothetical protein
VSNKSLDIRRLYNPALASTKAQNTVSSPEQSISSTSSETELDAQSPTLRSARSYGKGGLKRTFATFSSLDQDSSEDENDAPHPATKRFKTADNRTSRKETQTATSHLRTKAQPKKLAKSPEAEEELTEDDKADVRHQRNATGTQASIAPVINAPRSDDVCAACGDTANSKAPKSQGGKRRGKLNQCGGGEKGCGRWFHSGIKCAGAVPGSAPPKAEPARNVTWICQKCRGIPGAV